MADLTGQDVGRYHIIEQLGKGGMAVVYKAFDRRLEREVAIKFIRTERIPPDELAKMLIRFEREGKALARMEHASIIRVHDYGEHEGMPYLVMNYLPGGTLKEYARMPMPYPEAVKLLLPVARALEYAHRRGVVHRDVKPANILISEMGEPMLSDFGIARILESEEPKVTGTGVGIGTPEYMAPEQVDGIVTPAVDIYALGVVLYELVTGQVPYQADTPMAVVVKAKIDPLPRPSGLIAGLPPEIDWMLLTALAKRPNERYHSMGEMIRKLERMQVIKGVIPNVKVGIPKAGIPAAARPNVQVNPPERQPKPGENQLTVMLAPGVSMEFVRVPAGRFLMGSDEDEAARDDEKPQHEVYLSEYWIGKYPVTNAQYRAFLIETEYKKKGFPENKDSHPVVHVTWDDAVAFCDWVSKKTGRKICLPTEAQWEKAARGTDGRIYPWGNAKPTASLASCDAIWSMKDTTAVDNFPAGVSPYGALDMAGNVVEWVSDWYDEYYYRRSPEKNPLGPRMGQVRVLRGGDWIDCVEGDNYNIRIPIRAFDRQTSSEPNAGFRCAAK